MERGSIATFFIYIGIVISGLVVFYLVASEEYKVLFLPFLALFTVIAIVLFIWMIHSTPYKLNKKLVKIRKIIFHEPLEILKKLYGEIYDLYMRLSDRHKPKYYHKVVAVRHKLEEHMQSEKEVATLLHKAEGKSITELKGLYNNLYVHFTKLPHKVQGKYYARIVHLRQKMEQGK
jgi:amino acid transporter